MGSVDPSRLSPPAPLALEHRLDAFECEEDSLARWLKERAHQNEAQGASRTYVVAAKSEVVGYYCLSAGAVARETVSVKIRRNMPESIPVVLLGRLAVHRDWTGQGIGPGLLKDAVLRSLAVAESLGVRAMLCHAISPKAMAFYLRHGFVQSPIDPMTVMLSLTKLKA